VFLMLIVFNFICFLFVLKTDNNLRFVEFAEPDLLLEIQMIPTMTCSFLEQVRNFF